jgi:hypothetical protein
MASWRAPVAGGPKETRRRTDTEILSWELSPYLPPMKVRLSVIEIGLDFPPDLILLTEILRPDK